MNDTPVSTHNFKWEFNSWHICKKCGNGFTNQSSKNYCCLCEKEIMLKKIKTLKKELTKHDSNPNKKHTIKF